MLATDAIGAENDMIGATCELAKKGGRGGSAVRIRIAESRGLPPPRSFPSPLWFWFPPVGGRGCLPSQGSKRKMNFSNSPYCPIAHMPAHASIPHSTCHMLKAKQMEGEFVAGEGLTLTRWKLMVDDAAVVVTSLRTEYEENTSDGQVVVKLGGCGRRCQVTSSNISRSM